MSTEPDAGSQVSVPVFITGIITRSDGFDFCMDGADFRIVSMLGPARLKPSNNETREFLDRVAGTRARVVVAGYPTLGPECSYLKVYYAAPATDTVAALNIAM